MPPQITCAFHYLAKRKTRKLHFSLAVLVHCQNLTSCYLIFFNLFDSQLILTLLYDSLNLVTNAFSLGLLLGMVQEKGSRERRSSWTVLHTRCTSARSGFPFRKVILKH